MIEVYVSFNPVPAIPREASIVIPV